MPNRKRQRRSLVNLQNQILFGRMLNYILRFSALSDFSLGVILSLHQLTEGRALHVSGFHSMDNYLNQCANAMVDAYSVIRTGFGALKNFRAPYPLN